eukprot:15114192-Alexandrium_andersonii.AAC.1
MLVPAIQAQRNALSPAQGKHEEVRAGMLKLHDPKKVQIAVARACFRYMTRSSSAASRLLRQIRHELSLVMRGG